MFSHAYKIPVHRNHILLDVGDGHSVSILRIGDDTEVALGVHAFGMFGAVPIREWLAVPSPEWDKETYERLCDLFADDDMVADLLEVECAVSGGITEAYLVSKILSLAVRYVRIRQTEVK